jgi:hypothetical protein
MPPGGCIGKTAQDGDHKSAENAYLIERNPLFGPNPPTLF